MRNTIDFGFILGLKHVKPACRWFILLLAPILLAGLIMCMIGTTAAWCEPNPIFMAIDTSGEPSTKIDIGWSSEESKAGSHSVHIETTEATTDYAMVGVETDFTLSNTTQMSYWGYTVAGSDVDVPDEIWFEFENGDVICSTYSGGMAGQWIEWTLTGSSNWYISSLSPITVDLSDYYGRTVAKVFIGAGSPTSSGVEVDVYLDNLVLNGETLLDDNTGEIDVLSGSFCGYTGNTGIQVAIDAALSGATIKVAAGTYSENITINKSIILVGDDESTTIINGGGSDIVVTITASNVELSHFTVTGSGSTPLTDCGIALANVTGCTIQDNTVSDNGGVGIGLTVANNNTIEENTLDNNVIAAIGLMGSSLNQITFNVCTGTHQLSANYGYGIVLDGTDTTTFSTDNTIDGNVCSENEGDGIYFGWNCNENDVTGNTFIDNGNDGIYFWKSDTNTVTDNTIADNAAEGIQLMASPNNDISQNSITGSTIGILIRSGHVENAYPTVALSSGNTINENNISGNDEYGVKYEQNAYTDDDGIVIDADNNWWGAASGPYHATNHPDGTGDAVSDNVSYFPWYTDEGKTTLYNAITLTKTGPRTANRGNDITYTITYKNEGPSDFNATNVVITEDYPSEVEFVSSDPTPDAGTDNQWSIGDLASNAEGTIRVTVHIK